MIVIAILEDVDLLKVDVARMEADRVLQRKDPGNASIVYVVITFSRSASRKLVDLSGHSILSRTPLLRVALLRTIRPLPPLFLNLSRLY